MVEIARGAEAIISLEEKPQRHVLKDRIKKTYRIPEIDEPLRKSRTRREAKILKKLEGLAPEVLGTDSKEKIEMEYIDGQVIKDILDKNVKLAKEIGRKTGEIHDLNIIHGDLTTSNMLLDKSGNIRFIDFGLSFESHKPEDKAVDLHLFEEAVESKHFRAKDQIWKLFLEGYQPKNREIILKRLEMVQKRGRNKEKY